MSCDFGWYRREILSGIEESARNDARMAQQLEQLLENQKKIMEMFNRLSSDVDMLKKEIMPDRVNKRGLDLPENGVA